MSKALLLNEQISHAATSSVHYGALPEDLANFPGMVNLTAGSGVSLTPGGGTLTISATGSGGTVTSVGVAGSNGIGVSGSPITGSGTITLSLGAITPTSVSTGALTASGAISLPSGSITRANLANGAGFSVIGRAAGTSGALADITASGASKFLKTTSGGTALVFEAQAAADLPGGNWIGATNGTTVSAGVTIAANSTWYTIADISLSAGTYIVIGNVRANVGVSAGSGYCVSEFYNATSATSISNSQTLVVLLDNSWTYNNTSTAFTLVTVGSTSTIRFRIKRESIGATWTASTVSSDANGYSKITAVRLY